ncbi:hypothetical protein CFS9_24970 [Flavobacterium sp. CFS9]|uniref:Uncharacterized protein n=2 Tax=Flavobacterium sp. CFS9 TaxID=3143118 RepID=A0AAT9H2V6_9FLAO
MNDALNGTPLSTAIHNGSHTHYDNLVEGRLQSIIKQYGPNMTPDQAYKGLTDLISDIKTAIQNSYSKQSKHTDKPVKFLTYEILFYKQFVK